MLSKNGSRTSPKVNANCVAMIGRRSGDQASFFYQFRLDGYSIDPTGNQRDKQQARYNPPFENNCLSRYNAPGRRGHFP
jgi:hypothetical protein